MVDWWKKYTLTKALKRLFFEGKNLKPDAVLMLQWLAEEVNAKGRRIVGGNSVLYDRQAKFDAEAVAYWAGQRRMFDLLVAYLSVSPEAVFALASAKKHQNEELEKDLTLI